MEVYYDKIKNFRKHAKLSLTELCRQIDLTRAAFWKWETGKHSPSESKVRSIAIALKVNVDDISDLEPVIESSEANLSENVESWLLLGGKNEEKRINEQLLLRNLIIKHQRELRQASLLVRALMSSMDTVFYIKGINLKYIMANDAFLKLVSFKKNSNVLGLDDFSFFTQKEAEENSRQDLKVIQAGDPISGMEYYIPGTRKKKWGLIYKYPIIDSAGKIAGIIGTFVDISSRKEHERISELLKHSLDNSTDVITLRNSTTNRFLYVSKAVEHLYGYSIDKFYDDGSFWLNKCLHPDDKEEFLRFNKMDNKTVLNFRIITSNGQEKWIELRKYLGEQYVLSVIRDITDKKRDELKADFLMNILRKSKSNVYAVNKAYWELTTDTVPSNRPNIKSIYNIVHLNDALENYGRSQSILKSSRDYEIWIEKYLHPDDREKELEYYRKSIWPEISRYRVIKPNGEVRWIESTTYYGAGDYFYSIDTDITNKIKIEEKKDKKVMLKVAHSLKEYGVDMDVITKATGLSEEVICDL